MPRHARLVSLLIVLVLSLSQPSTLAMASAPTLAAAPTLAQPGPAVKQAFDLLIDHFVFAPDHTLLLRGGWGAAVTALKSKGAEGFPEEPPAFGAGRDADWRRFAAGYDKLAAAADGKFEKAVFDRLIVDGMAKSLGEGHTYFMSPEDYRAAQAQFLNRDRYGGIGVVVNEERKIIDIFEDSPAQAGGVQLGDQIVKVNGESIDGLSPTELSQKIRGEPGTPVELTVLRDGEPVVLKLVRAQIRVAWVTSRILDDGVGYLRIRTFPIPSALEDFRKAVARFQEKQIKALVVDLRGNLGGSVDTGVEIASTFIKNGPLYQQIDRRGGHRTVTAFGDYWEQTPPTAVLVNGASGSMSEILAAAMQERGVARVFGTKTSGNVAGALFYPLADGSGLSIANWVIKSGEGRPLDGVGLEPDEVIELDAKTLVSGTDNQLSAALGYVRQKAAAGGPQARHRPEVQGVGTRLANLPLAA